MSVFAMILMLFQTYMCAAVEQYQIRNTEATGFHGMHGYPHICIAEYQIETSNDYTITPSSTSSNGMIVLSH